MLVDYTIWMRLNFCPNPAIVHLPFTLLKFIVHPPLKCDLICAGVKNCLKSGGWDTLKHWVLIIPKEGGWCMHVLLSYSDFCAPLHLWMRSCRWGDQDLVIVQSIC